MASKGDDEMAKIGALLPPILDRPWPSSRPAWKVVVLPLTPVVQQGEDPRRCFIGFAYSHALGDGISALAFHRSFKDGIFDLVDKDCSVLTTPEADFPAPFHTKQNLPISWRFLLAPLIAVLLPRFIAELLGLRATVSTVTPDTWTGTRMFFEPKSFHTCLKMIEIPAPEVDNALRVARKNGAKLTGTLHQSIVRGLSLALPHGKAGNFVSGTAVNMRRAVGKSDDDMGMYVNAYFQSHERDDIRVSPWCDEVWARARAMTEKLSVCAVTLRDQPVGLLRYVPSIKKWTAGKIGQERDCSYDLGNLGAFEAPASQDLAGGARCRITHMIFTRPADATAPPMSINVASVKGSSMVITVSWQPGSFGIFPDSEPIIIENLCNWLKEDLKSLS